MDNLKDLQIQYDILKAHLSQAQDEIETFKTNISKQGAFINNERVEIDKKVWGAFWDINYYSHFDGHTNDPIYKEYTGAVILDEEEKEGIIIFISKWKTANEKEKNILISELEFPHRTPYPFLNEIERLCDSDYGKYKFENNEIKKGNRGIRFIVNDELLRLEVINPGEDQNECFSDSYIEFKISDKSDIETKKITEKESRG